MIAVAGAASVLLGAGPALAMAAAGRAGPELAMAGRAGDRVVLSGPVDVPSGQVAGEVVDLHGDVSVGGLVRGDVVVLDGRVNVQGQVSGDVVVFHGPVLLGPHAQVGGSVITEGTVLRKPGATVAGGIRHGFPVNVRAPSLAAGWLAVEVAVSISTLALGLVLLLLAPRGADAVFDAAGDALGASIGWGLGLLLGLPALAVLAVVTLVGLPFGIGLLLGLVALYATGYTWTVWIVGRAILGTRRSRVLGFLLGWLIMRMIGVVPFLGTAVWILASGLGLGAMAVAVWRARTAPRAPAVRVPEAGPASTAAAATSGPVASAEPAIVPQADDPKPRS